MTNSGVPKAWLPADTFHEEAQNKYLSTFAELVSTDEPFSFKLFTKGLAGYELSAEGSINQGVSESQAVEISLQATKRFQQRANVKELEARNFKRSHPTSTRWVREMPGKPSSAMVANHLFSGISHLVGFENSLGFTIIAKNKNDKELFTRILAKQQAFQDEISPDVTHF